MIFEPRPLDLARIIEIFRANKADDCIDLVGVIAFGQAIVPRFERELVPAVVRIGREGRPLPGFEVHEIGAFRETIFFRHLIGFVEHADGNTK